MNQPRQARRRFLQASGIGMLGLAGLPGTPGKFGSGAEPAADSTSPAGDATASLKLGFPTYIFKHYDLDQMLAIMRRLAVKYACLRSFHLPLEKKPDEIAAIIARVKAAGIVPYAGGVIYMKSEADVGRAMEYAKAARFKLITASPSPHLLKLLSAKAQAYDVRVAIHNHGPEDRDYPTPNAVYEKIKDLDPRIGICHDVGHTQRTGTDPSEAAVACADRLMDVHLKDVTSATADAHEAACGRGVVDIPKFLRTLIRIGYTGVVGVEHEKDMRDILPGLAESVGYTRGVLAVVEKG